MSTNTKERIIGSVVDLYNAKGIAHVRLQQIADECNMSVGNLAYHFPEQKLLMDTVITNSIDNMSMDLFKTKIVLRQFRKLSKQMPDFQVWHF